MDENTMKHSFRSSGHPEVPDHLRLKQVIVICRHGDRAPVSRNLGTLLNDGPESTSLWMSKLPARADIQSWNEAFPPRVLGDGCGRTGQQIWGLEDGPWGQLTTRGVEELRLVGAGLRPVICGPGEKKLFPDGIDAEKSSIFVRCTHIRRTHQSAQNMLKGLGLDRGVDLFVRPPERETLFPNSRTSGDKQAELIARINEENHWPGQEQLARSTAEMVGIETANLKWTTAREVLTCYEAHGVPLGDITEEMIQNVVDFTGWMWGRWFNYREMARLSLGPFLAEILGVMGLRGDEEGVPEAGIARRPKLAIFSGHDATLVPTLCALGLYLDDWPCYSSYITFEVAETEDGESVFRVVYNAREMTLPGATSVWLPLSELQQRLDDVMPHEEDSLPQTRVAGSSRAGSSEISSAVGGSSKNT